VQQAGQYAAQVATTYSPDIIVLGETLNYIGAPGTFESWRAQGRHQGR